VETTREQTDAVGGDGVFVFCLFFFLLFDCENDTPDCKIKKQQQRECSLYCSGHFAQRAQKKKNEDKGMSLLSCGKMDADGYFAVVVITIAIFFALNERK
jgi:hypothetical protein